MKTILVAITTLIITTSAYAQTDSINGKMSPPEINNPNDGIVQSPSRDTLTTHPDGYTMQNGKMMVVKDGKVTMMEKDVTLSNGTVIMTNGYYMKKGGTKMMMKEGQHMDIYGYTISLNTTTPTTPTKPTAPVTPKKY
ncbi:MAG: DUF6799 domain-containing protein [Bacteroidia bacterium]